MRMYMVMLGFVAMKKYMKRCRIISEKRTCIIWCDNNFVYTKDYLIEQGKVECENPDKVISDVVEAAIKVGCTIEQI